MKTIDKVILENGKTYDFSPNKKELYLTFLENNVIVLDNIDEKLGNIKNVLLDILKEVHKEIGVEYQYFILTNDKFLM